MTKVDIIANQEKFEVLKHALSSIGITGMTVSHVMGCGMQKGSTQFYRGVPVDADYEGSAGKINNDNMAGEKFSEFFLAAFQNMESVMEFLSAGASIRK